MPGGPGGFYDDGWLKGLGRPPRSSGSNAEALRYIENRDVLLINQRGARLPDRTFSFFGITRPGGSLCQTRDVENEMSLIQEGAKSAIENWQLQGMDLSGYDIENMIEDLNDIRSALGYDKIVLRGTSFGSQWSIAYMRKYPQHVDRAILGGVEPLDYGYDSPEGVWNVFKRLEEQIESSGSKNDLNLRKIPLTDAFRAVVKRLQDELVMVEAKHPSRNVTRTIPIGVEDFRRYIRTGINAGRESRESLMALPKFIYELYDKDYQYLASRVLDDLADQSGGSLQVVLIDNSLGISKSRDNKLDNEPGRQWVGELNVLYKATRDISPSPVIPDSFRELRTDIPILMVQGDLDLSTPWENAIALKETCKNSHLVRVHGGTHGTFNEAQRESKKFMDSVVQFLDSELKSQEDIQKVLGEMPTDVRLPELRFETFDKPTLFERLRRRN